MRSWRTAVVATLVVIQVAACSSPAPAPDGASKPTKPATSAASPAAPLATTPDGATRLLRTVAPTRYVLDLTVDPAVDRFSGTVAIDVDVAERTQHILLHADRLEFSGDAVIRVGDKAMRATRAAGVHQGIRLTTPTAIPEGRATIELSFSGTLADTGQGLYRIEDGADRYAFTQFESIYARRAFPCFDEPGFKASFEVTLRVPHGLVALANAPEIARTTEGALDVVRFAPTPKIPTYIVAMAVGPWDVVAAPPGTCSVPLRVVTARGKGRLAAWALGRTPRLLAELEEWFGEPYPFAKLDLIAAPKFDWGGMENAGLITFREDLLLLDASDLPVRDRLNAEDTIAHELAHMWFGDMVTPAWWDDLWLNEAFATWMATKIVDRASPDLDAGLESLAGSASTMRLDSRPDARAVRQPIDDPGDVFNAFDDITYGKGSRLLVMTEAWLGEKAFRRGVNDYLAKHRWGTATAEDLFAALGAASGRPVGEMLAGFLDRPGVPCIRSQGASREARVETRFVAQTRWTPTGTRLPDAPPWTVPVTIFQSWNTEYRPRTKVVAERDSSVELWTAGGAVSFNANGAGWYVFVPSPEELRAAVADTTHLSRADRVVLAAQIPLLRDSGDLPAAEAIDATLALARDGDRFTVGAACSLFRELDLLAVDDAARPAFQRLVRATLAPHLATVGLDARPGESARAEFLRMDLLTTLGTVGADEDVRRHCLGIARRFLADPERAPRGPLRAALVVAVAGGDAELWDAFHAALARPLPPDLRKRVVVALGSFGDPRLVERSCGLLLDGTARASEDTWSLAAVPSWGYQSDVVARARWNWVAAHYAELRKACGDESAAWFPSFAESLRTKADRDAVAAFFASVPSPPSGTERNLALALAAIEENDRRAGPLREGLAEFMARGK